MGEHGRGWGERWEEGWREGGGTTAPNPPKPSCNPTPLKKTFERTVCLQVWLGERRCGDPLQQEAKPPHPTTTARPTKAVSALKPNNPPKTATAHPPPPTKTDTPKAAEKKDYRPEDPIVGTVVHVLYATGIERGTVSGIHGRKYGAVRVDYPGGSTLDEVSRPLPFGTPEEAERYWDEAQSGKKEPKPPAPTNEETNPPNPNPTAEPANPTNPTNPPSGAAKMWDTTGSHEV